MKVGIEAKLFNLALRNRREELGLSQVALHVASGCTMRFISEVELLKMPEGRIGTIRANLNKLARALDIEFDALFPADYLDAIERKLLHHRRVPFLWCVDVSMAQLSAGVQQAQGLLANPEEDLANRETVQLIHDMWADVSKDILDERQRSVIEMRFGLDGFEEKTLEEVAQHFNLTRERVRQIERRSLEELRKEALKRRIMPVTHHIKPVEVEQ